MLRYLTAGESHGKMLVAVVEGVPAGLPVSKDAIDRELGRRQFGHGRGARMKIESDEVELLGGVRGGSTTGAPLALGIMNRDWENWKEVMDPARARKGREVHRPRPGHADLAGALKYGRTDVRDVLERASARETAARVAVGTVGRLLLREFGVDAMSHVVAIGPVEAPRMPEDPSKARERAELSPVRCADRKAGALMVAAIDRAGLAGDTLGGIFEVLVWGQPPGLGSYAQWDRKLSGRLAMAVCSIQAVKGVEFGLGFEMTRRPGSKVHDEILPKAGGRGRPAKRGSPASRAGGTPPAGSPRRGALYRRGSNNAGGLEGGMTNGQPLVIRGALKPISTLRRALRSVDLRTGAEEKAAFERSDVCVVPAAGVIAEAVVLFELATAFTEKFPSDTLREMKAAHRAYLASISRR
jgi:chorismate synthase